MGRLQGGRGVVVVEYLSQREEYMHTLPGRRG